MHDADRQQAPAFRLHGGAGARVGDELTARPGGVADPALPRRQRPAVRQEERAERLGGEEAVEDIGYGPVRHQDRFARRRDQPRRPQFAPHATDAERALTRTREAGHVAVDQRHRA